MFVVGDMLSLSKSSGEEVLESNVVDNEVFIKIERIIGWVDIREKIFLVGVSIEFDEMETEIFWGPSIESLTVCSALTAVQNTIACPVC